MLLTFRSLCRLIDADTSLALSGIDGRWWSVMLGRRVVPPATRSALYLSYNSTDSSIADPFCTPHPSTAANDNCLRGHGNKKGPLLPTGLRSNKVMSSVTSSNNWMSLPHSSRLRYRQRRTLLQHPCRQLSPYPTIPCQAGHRCR